MLILLFTKTKDLNLGLETLSWQAQDFVFFSLVVCLVPVNWFLETLKWHFAYNSTVGASTFKESLRAVANGLLGSMLLPFRIGESLAKSTSYQSKFKPSVFYLSVACSQVQNLIILLAGVLVLALGLGSFRLVEIYTIDFSVWLTVAAVVTLLIIGLYTVFKSVRKQVNICITNLRFAVSPKILLLTAARYCIYVAQFALLLMAFSSTITSYLAEIILFFFFLTISPALTLGKVGIREFIASYVFASSGLSLASILMATTSLWFLNLVLPVFVISGYKIFAFAKPALKKLNHASAA